MKSHLRLFAASFAGFSALASIGAQAALIAQDQYNGSYTGFSGQFSSGTIGSPGLTYSKSGATLATDGGSIRTTTNFANRNLSTPVTASEYYISFLVDSTGVTGTRVGITLNNSSGTEVAEFGYNGPLSWLQVNNSGTYTGSYDNTTVTEAVHLYVLKVSTSGSIATLSLYFDPTPGVEPAVADVVSTVSAFSLGSLRMTNTSATATPTPRQATFDELRIGTTFADVAPAVIPETSAALLLLMAGALATGRRSRR